MISVFIYFCWLGEIKLSDVLLEKIINVVYKYNFISTIISIAHIIRYYILFNFGLFMYFVSYSD